MLRRPLSVTAALALIFANALVWLIFGALVALRAHPALPAAPLVRAAMALTAFAAAGLLAGLCLLLARRSRAAYYPAIAFLSVAALLGLFDDFGLADLAALIIALLPVLLLLKDRDWYLRRGPARGNS